MVEIAEIFRIYGPEYRAKFGHLIPPSHLRVMQNIEQCRTPVLGGEVFYCDSCLEFQYSYHSCKNRHCPKCQNDSADQWLKKQQEMLLGVPYFLVTSTLPDSLRDLARSNQKLVYNILFRAASEALQELAKDPRFVGGLIGIIGVLHTWTRAMHYHPHVHFLVPAGGLSEEGQWLLSREDFLVPVKALSVIFRAKFRDALRKTPLFDLVPPEVWQKDWVVHCEPVGNGTQALKYLAPYIFRVAISNNRILKVEEGQVTFRYKDSKTHKTQISTVSAEEFIRRFLQHVLPDHFVKVRYYGLFSPANRDKLRQVRDLIGQKPVEKPTPQEILDPNSKQKSLFCPKCGGPMRLIETLRRKGRSP